MLQKYRFRHGATLLTKRSNHNDIVAIQANFSGGSRLDPPQQAGLTCLTFSLLLKDTLHRSATEVAERLESVGGSVVEDVRKDFGGISALCTSEGLPMAVELLADAIRRPAFLPHKVELEKHNLLMAIREEEDSPLEATFKLFQKEIYGEHPYARPSRGQPETVVDLRREHVFECHSRRLRPDKLILTAVGNVDEEELRAALEDALGDWEMSAEPEVEEKGPKIGASVPGRSVTRVKDSEGVWSVLGYLAPPIGHPDHAAMKVLDCILGGSVDSRLFAEVRDRRGLAYVVGSSYVERKEPGVITAYWGTSPERQEATLAAVLDETARAREELPTEDELERAKKYLRGVFLIAQETNLGQASLFNLFETLGLGYRYVECYPGEIEAVTAEDVMRVAQRYFGEHTLAMTVPEKRSANASPIGLLGSEG